MPPRSSPLYHENMAVSDQQEKEVASRPAIGASNERVTVHHGEKSAEAQGMRSYLVITCTHARRRSPDSATARFQVRKSRNLGPKYCRLHCCHSSRHSFSFDGFGIRRKLRLCLLHISRTHIARNSSQPSQALLLVQLRPHSIEQS